MLPADTRPWNATVRNRARYTADDVAVGIYSGENIVLSRGLAVLDTRNLVQASYKLHARADLSASALSRHFSRPMSAAATALRLVRGEQPGRDVMPTEGVYFNHMRKAAGSTTIAWLQHLGQARHFFVTQQEYSFFPAMAWFKCHPTAFFVVTLREPISRHVSEYFYAGPPYKCRLNRDALNTTCFAEAVSKDRWMRWLDEGGYTPMFTAIFFAEMHAIQAAPRHYVVFCSTQDHLPDLPCKTTSASHAAQCVQRHGYTRVCEQPGPRTRGREQLATCDGVSGASLYESGSPASPGLRARSVDGRG